MRILFLCLSLTIITQVSAQNQSMVDWTMDFELACETAKAENKYIIISFAGSDWCKPCIMLSREVLETSEFNDVVTDKFIPVLADFPRLKKNRLSPQQQTHNENLASKYNPSGAFPLLVVVDAAGNKIFSADYKPGSKSELLNKLSTL
jgi:thioredoxin-related protein